MKRVTLSASTIWVDAGVGQTIYRTRTNSGVGSILSATQGCSNADWSTCWESAETLNTPAPVASQYLPVKPDAVLYFSCADTTVASLRIPSPKVGIFLADQTTVDPANTDVVALVAAAVGNLASASGSLATFFVAGRLDTTRR